MDILLFGITKDIVGKARLTIGEDGDINTVGNLKAVLKRLYPEIGRLSSLAIAVDSEYADDEMVITPNSEIALIPPVSGG